jgi:hypothetical protein
MCFLHRRVVMKTVHKALAVATFGVLAVVAISATAQETASYIAVETNRNVVSLSGLVNPPRRERSAEQPPLTRGRPYFVLDAA